MHAGEHIQGPSGTVHVLGCPARGVYADSYTRCGIPCSYAGNTYAEWNLTEADISCRRCNGGNPSQPPHPTPAQRRYLSWLATGIPPRPRHVYATSTACLEYGWIQVCASEAGMALTPAGYAVLAAPVPHDWVRALVGSGKPGSVRRVEAYTEVGSVRRISRDGRWADVLWPGGHPKRMSCSDLEVVTQLTVEAWTFLDLRRRAELNAVAGGDANG